MHQNYNLGGVRVCCQSIHHPPTRRIHTLTVCFLKHDNYFTHSLLSEKWKCALEYVWKGLWWVSEVKSWKHCWQNMIIINASCHHYYYHVLQLQKFYNDVCVCVCSGESPRKMLHSNNNNLKFMSSVNNIQVIRHVSFMT